MPRATSTSAEEPVVKKAPRKRTAPKKTATGKKNTTDRITIRKTTTRKTTACKTKPTTKKTVPDQLTSQVESATAVAEKEMSTTRKAPTKFAEAQAVQKSKRSQYLVIGLLLLIGTGSSAVVGFSDSEAGQINVAQTIKERNERMANLVDVNGPTVIVPTPSQVPDGGLVGLRPADPVPTAVATTTFTTMATTTATSTEGSNVTENTTIADEEPVNQSATDTATTTVDAVAADPEQTDSNP